MSDNTKASSSYIDVLDKIVYKTFHWLTLDAIGITERRAAIITISKHEMEKLRHEVKEVV
jgi:hypothetical protein